ncbi:MAG: glycerol-3-phosphate 1-O-acyltransferase PlsY [Georgfuchsia sp.]
MNVLVFVLLGYLLGSVSFAVIVSRLFGIADPRSFGSGNPGATNVLRSGNKLAALLTLVGDAAKGWAAIWLARKLDADDLGVAAAGIAAFIGHVFPLFLKFKGGKGVATALGVLAGFNGGLALICAGVWLLAALATRYSSLAAILAAISAPAAATFLGAGNGALVAVTAMSAILILRHRDNIKRLLAGTEGRIGGKKKSG